ncbi:hypothetical protein AUJ46_05680 [Candidatus Peregrinibacteria bacterium CG1_02_54_53]|nr:MAG: hypothetical protein AUJ46_05680 [Candidatus Peregrinibacteria bacterium CG1_02_54_53]
MTDRKKNPRVYLQDILDAIAKVETYASEGEHDFFKDGKTQDAVIRQISIVGEAAAKLPAALRAQHREIPWRQIIGMRNIVVHDYSETDLPMVWKVAERDLPALKKAIEKIVKTAED